MHPPVLNTLFMHLYLSFLLRYLDGPKWISMVSVLLGASASTGRLQAVGRDAGSHHVNDRIAKQNDHRESRLYSAPSLNPHPAAVRRVLEVRCLRCFDFQQYPFISDGLQGAEATIKMLNVSSLIGRGRSFLLAYYTQYEWSSSACSTPAPLEGSVLACPPARLPSLVRTKPHMPAAGEPLQVPLFARQQRVDMRAEKRNQIGYAWAEAKAFEASNAPWAATFTSGRISLYLLFLSENGRLDVLFG